ncbi:MAG: putative transport system ATP-binding protein [Gaiellales bacterium]|jgi:putative ABC transport system ATP-binding protein|nr:putative transport system ATP-binding protein [Gaiellales bacterium]MDX6596230.1 putative transport system ATP-binding protein [Gaiellales bacterium]
MRILDASDLYRFYHAGDEETLALRGVSVTAEPGELIAVVGPSGSGKSTLLACIAGLDEPDGGVVHVAGERVSRRSEAVRTAIRARSIGMLFQSGNLLGHLSVEGNVLLAQQLNGRADIAAASAIVESVGLGSRAHSLPAQLSGGETARAGLAVALANDPPLLLADEPTGELDSETADQIVALLLKRAAAGCAVVAATHNRRLADTAHRTVELVDGRVTA